MVPKNNYVLHMGDILTKSYLYVYIDIQYK